jgi:hypothetical protein
LIWQYRGSSTLQLKEGEKKSQTEISLNAGDVHLVNTTDEVRAVGGKDSCLVAITNRAFD